MMINLSKGSAIIKSIFKTALILGIFITPLNVYAAAGDVWIEPPSTSVSINSLFTLEVHADAGTEKLGAYQFTITFDPARINIDTTAGTNGVQADTEGFIAAVNTDNTNGTIIVNGFDISGTGPGSNLRVLIINFNALNNPGQSTIGLTVNILANESGVTIGTPNGTGGSLNIMAPDITVADSSELAGDLLVPFGDQPGTTHTVSVTNNGQADLHMGQTSYMIIGPEPFWPFQITENCSETILIPSPSPTDTCTIVILFDPGEEVGAWGKVIRLYSDDPDEPEVVVSMCGTSPGVAWPWSSTSISTDIQIATASSCLTNQGNHPPEAPELLSPVDGLTALGTTVTFIWKRSTDPEGDPVTYDLYYCENQDFSGCVPLVAASPKNRRVVRFRVTGLNTNTTYYWKVIAKDDKGAGKLSETRSFTTRQGKFKKIH